MRFALYDRRAAVLYAHRWAYGRNPAFYDYEGLGGDCTNFASQCIYAGSGVMNFTPTFGWYYIDSNHTPVVVAVGRPASAENILIAAHSYDADDRPLSTYEYKDIRFLKIYGVWKP